MKTLDNCKSALGPIGLALALCFSVAPAAQATTFSNFLTFDGPSGVPSGPNQSGGEDKLQDDSVSKLVQSPNNTTGLYEVGDIVYGILTLSEIQASGLPSVSIGANSQIAILFSASITSLTGGSNGSIALGATPTSSAYDVAELCGALCSGAGIGSSTIGVFLSTNQSSANSANDPINWTTSNFTTNFNTLGPWSWEMTFGLSNLVAGGDFFDFQAAAAGRLNGSDVGAFTITSSAFAVKDWLPVDVADWGNAVHTADLTLDIGTVGLASTATGGAGTRGWTFTDHSDLYVNAVPEPGTLALLGMGLLGLGMAKRRRS